MKASAARAVTGKEAKNSRFPAILLNQRGFYAGTDAEGYMYSCNTLQGHLVRLRAAYGWSRYPGGMVLRHEGTGISSLLHIHRTLRYYMLAGSITGERGGDCGLSDSGEFVPALAATASLHIPDVRICDADIVRKMFSWLYALMGRLAGLSGDICDLGRYAIAVM